MNNLSWGVKTESPNQINNNFTLFYNTINNKIDLNNLKLDEINNSICNLINIDKNINIENDSNNDLKRLDRDNNSLDKSEIVYNQLLSEITNSTDVKKDNIYKSIVTCYELLNEVNQKIDEEKHDLILLLEHQLNFERTKYTHELQSI